MRNYIEYYRNSGKSENEIQLLIIKEYLLEQKSKLQSEIYVESDAARLKGVPTYLINIFEAKLEERKKHIDSLLANVLGEIKQIIP